jgi:hypothetical protein
LVAAVAVIVVLAAFVFTQNSGDDSKHTYATGDELHPDVIYTCPTCGWEGKRSEMHMTNYIMDDGRTVPMLLCPDCSRTLGY